MCGVRSASSRVPSLALLTHSLEKPSIRDVAVTLPLLFLKIVLARLLALEKPLSSGNVMS